jgi:hypothetical protein
VMLPVVPDLLGALVRFIRFPCGGARGLLSIVQSACRRLLVSVGSRCSCIGDSLQWFMLPVIPVSWFVVCADPESRGLPHSHIVMLVCTSSVCKSTPVVHSCYPHSANTFFIGSLLHFAAGLLSFLRTLAPQYRMFPFRHIQPFVSSFRCVIPMASTALSAPLVSLNSISMSRPSAVDCIAGLFFQSSVGLFPYLSIYRIVAPVSTGLVNPINCISC